MIVHRQLLEVLVCPITKVSLSILERSRLEKLNRLIEAGAIQSVGGEQLKEPLKEALITDNGSTIYPVEDSIPIMLEDRSISCHQIDNWQ